MKKSRIDKSSELEGIPKSQRGLRDPSNKVPRRTKNGISDRTHSSPCDVEVHANSWSKTALQLYLYATRVQFMNVNPDKKGERIWMRNVFYASVKDVAEKRFEVDECTVGRAAEQLCNEGWFKLVSKGGVRETNHYKVFTHAEWAADHPGMCLQEEITPWTGEGHSLGKILYSRSGGRCRFREFESQGILKEAKRLNLTTEQVLSSYDKYYIQKGSRQKPSNVAGNFWAHLREHPTTWFVH